MQILLVAYHISKLKTTQILELVNGLINWAHLYNAVLLSNKKERVADTRNNVGEAHMYYAR